ncbi:DUF4199 domain-containing protein [Mucilaginibacter robiniae]|uniref:DUF4199 domain-containing protein n=1 Tax=Mucilaginibacter robiniae TaxID=2728022 RepID=A0A7L5E0K7_9SPHI|nr:DUF4199 domain-containing protein [Mucilaginibacter robiniae]QJD95074.1 DUF4199 domain-containing protein [Mucilaginibacter robiniae]
MDILLRKEGALRGLLFGGILLAVNILLIYYTAYIAQVPGVFFVVSFIGSFVVQIGLALLFTASLRKKIGGYWTLKQATSGLFVMLFVTYLISSVGRWVFSNYIDQATVQKANTETLAIQRKALQSTHRSEADIQSTLEATQKSMNEGDTLSIGRVIQNLLISVILIFAIAAILGALFKREPPLLRQVPDDAEL